MREIKTFKHEDLQWSFNSKDPFVYIRTEPWNETVYVDPFPCHTHNSELVAEEVKHIANICKLPQYKVYILPYEDIGRCNGHATENLDYEKGTGKSAPYPHVVLYGKRIPIMQSMTRYLVAHEFGHVVHYYLAHKMGKTRDEFTQFYAENIRKIEVCKDYGYKWPLNTGEVIANDIRICLFNRELEFWPHQVPFPSETIYKYWKSINESWFV